LSYPSEVEPAIFVTGQFSTQLPQPVQMSVLTLRARLFTLTLNFPAEPSTDSMSAYVSISIFKCRPTSTSLGEIIHMAQSLVGNVLSSWDMTPPMEGDFSIR
jgi:hypothetical protein